MSSLRSRTGNALAWDLFGNYGGQLSGLIISIFLARLLEPSEFGLVGMSLVFIAILQVFTTLGFGAGLIQNKNNSSLTYSSVFYLNIGIGTLLTIVVYFAAPLVGTFYGNHQVTDLVRIFSVTFFINSFNVVQQTILKKGLKFKILTVRNLIANIFAGVLAVILAFQGFGVYSLVIQNIVGSVIATAILWKVSKWYPKWEFSWSEVKKLTAFSTYVFAASSLNTIITRADSLIIGKLFSPATLGFFSRANSLDSLIIKNSSGSLSAVFFPALATIHDDNQKFESVYLRIISIVTDLSVYLTGAFFLIGEEVIIGLFGAKWQPSVFIFQILILKGFTYPISVMIVNAFMAKGKSKENFQFGNIRKILQLAPLAIAYFYGFNLFLYALVASSLLNWILNNFFASRSLNISLKRQFQVAIPNILFIIVLLYIIRIFFVDELNYFIAIFELLSFSLFYFLFLLWRKSPLLTEINLVFQKLKLRCF